jgi:ATP-dependent Clp protease ATP-binding subunit ClpC
MFELFNDQSIKVIMIAQQEARNLGHRQVGLELLLIGVIAQSDNAAAKVLKEGGLTLLTVLEEVERLTGRGSIRLSDELPFSSEAKQVLDQALQVAKQLGQSYVGPEHLLLALLKDEASVVARVLRNQGIDPGEVRKSTIRAIGEKAAVSPNTGRARIASNSKRKALKEFATDLNQLAIQGKIDSVIGREAEIERVIQILGRRSKNNPMLIGEPGVGKTAIAEGLAQRIVRQEVPELLVDKCVMSLDIGSLLAGTSVRGEFEERLQQIVAEVREAGNIILLIDEVHTLVGAGATQGTMDAANLLKPALARGELQCIGATTLNEYRQYIETDAALERRFQPVMVNEPTAAATLEILQGVRGQYEQHHKLTITDAALAAAAKLADRYIADRYLPDKAIDLIDEAGSLVHLRHAQKSPARQLKLNLRQVTQDQTAAVQVQDFDQASQLRDRQLELEAQLQQLNSSGATVEQPVVVAEDIAQVVSAWTGIPVNQLTQSESAVLMQLETTLHQRLIGHESAVSAVSRAIRRARVGLRTENRPIASFIFCGPTGVGKTELAKAMAASIFGSESNMIRLDMSEYMESQSVSKLIGSPPGYVGYGEGGQLTEIVRRKPYSVILLDEIEKAHPNIFNLLLQLLDDGRLTDAQGRVVNFTNTLIIMTSNLGARAIEKQGSGLGFAMSDSDGGAAKYHRTHAQVNDALKLAFRPEFLNRLDEIIVFQQLTRSQVEQIAELLLQEVANRLSERQVQIEVTDAFKAKLINEGYDPSYGARPLRRAVTRFVEDTLAEAILAGQIDTGATAILNVNEDGQVIVQRKQSLALVGAS